MPVLSQSVHIAYSAASAFAVLSDIHTILRLSPFWTLTKLTSDAAGPPDARRPGDRYQATLEHYATAVTETITLEFREIERNSMISLAVGDSALTEIVFLLERSGDGVLLTQRLSLRPADDAVVEGTRGELASWLKSIAAYISLAAGRSLPKRLMKRFMDRIWLRLTLSERKIAAIITTVSVLELIILLILVLIWNLAMR